MEITSLSGNASIKAMMAEKKMTAIQLLEILAAQKGYSCTKSNFSKKSAKELFYLCEVQMIADVLDYDLYLVDCESGIERKFTETREAKMFYNDFLRTMGDLKFQLVLRSRP